MIILFFRGVENRNSGVVTELLGMGRVLRWWLAGSINPRQKQRLLWCGDAAAAAQQNCLVRSGSEYSAQCLSLCV